MAPSTTKLPNAYLIATIIVLCGLSFLASPFAATSPQIKMYKSERTVIQASSPEVVRYRILDTTDGGGGAVLTYAQMLDNLVDRESGAAAFLHDLLASHMMRTGSAYFFECAPTSRHTAGQQPFEFVLLPAEALEGVKADLRPFETHIAPPSSSSSSSSSPIVSFHNLGGDALLVVPRPLSTTSSYAHLAEFIRTAPRAQATALWVHVAEAVRRQLAAASDDALKVWVSTSGMGVYWLHVRLDSSPKYYNYKPYKT